MHKYMGCQNGQIKKHLICEGAKKGWAIFITHFYSFVKFFLTFGGFTSSIIPFSTVI